MKRGESVSTKPTGDSVFIINVLKLVGNTVKGKDRAEEKTEHYYKHLLAVHI